MKGLNFFLVCLVLVPLTLYAQGKEHDPLHKPQIWKRLQANPSNEALWIAYFGKDLFDLSDKEYENFTDWKNQLIQARDNVAKPVTKKQETKKNEYYNSVYGKIKDPYYQNLISNINSNFLMIEEYFHEQYDFYNAVYVFYSDKHPKGNFDKEQWISEQEKKLEELRSQQ